MSNHRSIASGLVRPFLTASLLLGSSEASLAQEPARPDTTRRDSAKVILPEITVTVTRTQEPLTRVPAAVDVLDRDAVRRAQATRGLDEALNNIPGVYIPGRRDPRLTIRGFGSRANFGIRGVKILLDGVPQTLPDGQSQLDNVEFGSIERIEVLHGSASSLYGNASGGVVSFFTEAPGLAPFGASIRSEGGSYELFKILGWSSGRSGPVNGGVTVSRFSIGNFRQHSAAEGTQLNLRGDWQLSGSANAALRFYYSDQPTSENPGALTYAEYVANPDSAAANNIRRNAGGTGDQEQLSLTVRHVSASAAEYSATFFGFLRTVKGMLATGTYTAIDRKVGGVRLSGSTPLARTEAAARMTYGLDLQRMRDGRTNNATVAGVPDTLVLDQTEKVTEVGPFVQLVWSPVPRITLNAGGRYDWVIFDVADHHVTDGADNSGSRTMHAASGQVGVSVGESDLLVPYANVSTSFETPTTTELVNQPGATGGFNDQLGPQRAVTFEVGARGRIGRGFSYSVAGFLGRITDAIVPYTEVGGRAYFQNAGKLRNDGIEVGLSGEPVSGIRLFGSCTYAHYRFVDYQRVTGTTVDTLDGKLLPGVPKAFIRLGLRTRFLERGALDVDHTMSSSLFADDLNTLRVNGWGAKASGAPEGFGKGVTNLRLSWDQPAGSAQIAPFVGVNNLWNKQYVGSVVINGVNGRVFEPAPRINVYAGAQIGWAKR
jgi:iron complex outermembrane receptor protein